MTVLLVGNMGYLGTLVLRHLRKVYAQAIQAILVGFDTGLLTQYP